MMSFKFIIWIHVFLLLTSNKFNSGVDVDVNVSISFWLSFAMMAVDDDKWVSMEKFSCDVGIWDVRSIEYIGNLYERSCIDLSNAQTRNRFGMIINELDRSNKKKNEGQMRTNN